MVQLKMLQQRFIIFGQRLNKLKGEGFALFFLIFMLIWTYEKEKLEVSC